jgi:hypothetical protein
LLLQGFSLLNQLRSGADAAERQRILEEAAGPLFRAAASLGAAAAAPEPNPGRGGSRPLVWELLQALLLDVTGTYQHEGPQVTHDW